ncbi:hypothetical protein QTI51_23025 [Variovorax sp. J22G73]|uniref:hypothetical protein n=1 Tax=unclassified Variovorax TaxID=663243 RepID=UPI002576B39D|nr:MULTISPECIES: hypothetical protein [unclassified Variovorax]MDM0007464.1 hypothetical protein [Variovorax sp. J22R203]MDM0100176.1 hypothetical protein [Variovorax sp. J22G73]
MAASQYKFNLLDSTSRTQHIQQRATEALQVNRVKRETKFRGGREALAIIQMNIHHLLYRLENFRTLSDQLSQVAAGKAEENLFAPSRREDVSAQTAQHDILFRLAQKGSGDSIIPIYDELRRVKEQNDELIISADGVVVNGNRRLAAMRELFASGDGAFSGFQTVSCAVLPESATDDEVVALEIELQMQPDTKLPYDWTSVALAARALKSRNYPDQVIASMMNRDIEEIRRLVKMIDGADLYLEDHLQKPRAYNELDETEQAFKQIAIRNLAKSDNTALREVTRKFDFLVVENRSQIEQRAYELINNIEANPEVFLDNIAGVWGVDLNKVPEEPDSELEISFEDIVPTAGQKDYAALTRYIDELGDDATARSNAARAVEEASVLAGEQGKRKDLAALKFAKSAQQKLTAINLRYANETTFDELRTVLAGCVTHCEALAREIDARRARG